MENQNWKKNVNLVQKSPNIEIKKKDEIVWKTKIEKKYILSKTKIGPKCLKKTSENDI